MQKCQHLLQKLVIDASAMHGACIYVFAEVRKELIARETAEKRNATCLKLVQITKRGSQCRNQIKNMRSARRRIPLARIRAKVRRNEIARKIES